MQRLQAHTCAHWYVGKFSGVVIGASYIQVGAVVVLHFHVVRSSFCFVEGCVVLGPAAVIQHSIGAFAIHIQFAVGGFAFQYFDKGCGIPSYVYQYVFENCIGIALVPTSPTSANLSDTLPTVVPAALASPTSGKASATVCALSTGIVDSIVAPPVMLRVQ